MENVNIKVRVATSKVGSDSEDIFSICKEDWESMSDKERDEIVLEECISSGILEFSYEESPNF